jgi:hypothetical protein
MRFWFALFIVIAGVVLRVIPHPWNFAPVGAIALFAGAHFERRWIALLAPLATMFAADTILGYHSLMPVIYATYALIAVIGMLLRDRRTSVPLVGGAALLSSTIFFITTNFANWMISPMYEKSAAGLIACYIAGIPFFGNTLASDVIFTALFFSTYAFGVRRLAAAFPS